MMRGIAVAGIVGVLAGGCLLDRSTANRPARFYAGPAVRTINVPAPPATTSPIASRTTTPEPEGSVERLSALSASFQFTMKTANGTYAGGEVEAGRLERDGSNLGGAYGVIGAEHASRFGALGAELTAGWRGLRFHYGDQEQDDFVIEPRVRGQVWIGEQWTIGGAVGARLGGDGEWMAGAYLGVHSDVF